jgi:putative tricarboxylic transport membrane protein
MARKGRAGPALGISAFGSFIAGTISLIGLTFIAGPLAKVALKFGPPEFTSLLVLGFLILSYLTSGSMIRALSMSAVGLILGTIGVDFISGKYRFTYGFTSLEDGIGLIPVVMGLFGISEVLMNVETPIKQQIFKTTIRDLFPNLQDWKASSMPILRGSILGFFLGVLPGGGALISSFTSYALEKKLSKTPEKFGTGVIEGVAGPESANNAGTSGAFVPLLTLGIPCNPAMALILGALIIFGLQPGPVLLKEAPELFWGTITSMYIGNVMLLALNLPLIGLWVQILKIPYPVLFPIILILCCIGSYSINNATNDVIIMIIFGIVGYLMKKSKYEAAPLVLALILGPIFENSLRQSLIMAHGSFSIFITRPISLGFLAAAVILLVLAAAKKRRFRERLKEMECLER